MKMIKSLFAASVIGATFLASSNAAQILVQNVTTNNQTFFAIGTTTGDSIAAGTGTVAIGTFSFSDAQIMAATSDPGSFAALLADFTQFGSSTSFGSVAAFGSPSLYRANAVGPTANADAYVGNAIYTVATTSDSIAGATDIFVYKHAINFEADNPLFTAEANPALGNGTLLLGTPDGAIDTLAGPQGGALVVAPIPEPSVFALFGIVGSALVFRRRR